MKTRSALLLLTLSLSQLSAQVLITFDPPILHGGSYQLATFYQGGLDFTYPSTSPSYFSFGITDSGMPGRPDNSTAFFDLERSAQFRFRNNSLFSLTRLDVAEVSDIFPDPQPFELIGHKRDGTTVDFTSSTAGIPAGTIPSFQTVTLPDRFTDLLWVEFGPATGAICIDNLSVTVVPEPATALLLLLGIVLLAHPSLRGRAFGRSRQLL